MAAAMAEQSCSQRPSTLWQWFDRVSEACLPDTRQSGKVDHQMVELMGKRVYGLACGYEDANDAARSGADPMHKPLAGPDRLKGLDLASQPTLSRFENSVTL